MSVIKSLLSFLSLSLFLFLSSHTCTIQNNLRAGFPFQCKVNHFKIRQKGQKETCELGALPSCGSVNFFAEVTVFN